MSMQIYLQIVKYTLKDIYNFALNKHNYVMYPVRYITRQNENASSLSTVETVDSEPTK